MQKVFANNAHHISLILAAAQTFWESQAMHFRMLVSSRQGMKFRDKIFYVTTCRTGLSSGNSFWQLITAQQCVEAMSAAGAFLTSSSVGANTELPSLFPLVAADGLRSTLQPGNEFQRFHWSTSIFWKWNWFSVRRDAKAIARCKNLRRSSLFHESFWQPSFHLHLFTEILRKQYQSPFNFYEENAMAIEIHFPGFEKPFAISFESAPPVIRRQRF